MGKRSRSAAALRQLDAAVDGFLRMKMPPPLPRLPGAAAVSDIARIYDQAAAAERRGGKCCQEPLARRGRGCS